MPRANYENPPDDLIRLGGAMRLLRRTSGLRQKDLAAMTGMPESQISDIERGKNNPGWLLTIRILGGMGRSVGDLASAYTDAGREP
jgi:transcriptional regulator with XRE-family HTH domain